ncbi:MAG: AAA family ATPase [Candidatus Aenigmarchaeota archaeon]|nr:AAA family ATPase [Candidatus Aenigmarchaeota archaeon]
MPGAGKTSVSKILEKKGFIRVRFGDITDQELKKRSMALTEENERFIRESLRVEYGMDAYAKMSLPKIKKAADKSQKVVIDGLYSLEEFLLIRKKYPELTMLFIFSSPETRHERLMKLKERVLTLEECVFRDISLLENLKSGGPIALADHAIVNQGTLNDLEKNVLSFLKKIS